MVKYRDCGYSGSSPTARYNLGNILRRIKFGDKIKMGFLGSRFSTTGRNVEYISVEYSRMVVSSWAMGHGRKSKIDSRVHFTPIASFPKHQKEKREKAQQSISAATLPPRQHVQKHSKPLTLTIRMLTLQNSQSFF